MIAEYAGATVEVIDYELVRVDSGAGHAPIGDFRDAHLCTEPRWRLVAGYLMLEADDRGFLVSSHGRPVARMLGGAVRGVRSVDGSVAYADGVAFVADAPWRVHDDEATSGAAEWAVTIVHGPAPEKIANRIRLLRSLERVGGRRA